MKLEGRRNSGRSLGSFLIDISEHLAHQYLVKFQLSPAPESGVQTVFVFSESIDQELMKPDRVWVPAALQTLAVTGQPTKK
jgi:hypothetical protein